ncbi:MAG: hypothetical protein V3U54_03900 [Thermodesulfobacteriota bacterium]
MNKVEFVLSDDLKVYCGDELPRDKRLFAAKGLIPIPPSKLALVLFKLTLDKDQEIVEEASNSLRDIPENVIETLVSDTSTHVGLLDFLAKQSFSENVLQHIVINNNTEDETISFIAENVHSQPIIDAIANNHGRILRSGKIVESLSNNPVVSRSTLDRVLSFINLYLHKDAVDSPEFNKVQYDIDDPELRESVSAVENSFFDEIDLSDELIDESDEDEAQDDEEEIDGEELTEIRSDSFLRQIKQLTMAYRLKLAMLGNRDARSILLRDRNRVVSRAVLKNPRLTDTEVVMISQSKVIDEDILREISSNRKWMRIYQVKTSLVNNPKTPSHISINLIKQLRNFDIRSLIGSKDLPSAVTMAARRVSKERREGGKE